MSLSDAQDPPGLPDILKKVLSAPIEEQVLDHKIQNYNTFNGVEWITRKCSNERDIKPVHTFRLLTWNIDVLSPGGEPRMRAALNYLKQLTASIKEPIVLFFQEMSPSDLNQIRNTDWVQQRFNVTDLSSENWPAGQAWCPTYGTTTLVDKHLTIQSIFRVTYTSRFQRDALFVDLKLCRGAESVLRLCNTHLESLALQPPLRPKQIATAAQVMKANGVHASILAGDLNAIEPFDRTLHTMNELKDVYLDLGGQEDREEGYTWGQQASKADRERFGCSRMDKAFYCGNIRAVSIERIGQGIAVEDEAERTDIKARGGEVWASDHLGLSFVFGLDAVTL